MSPASPRLPVSQSPGLKVSPHALSLTPFASARCSNNQRRTNLRLHVSRAFEAIPSERADAGTKDFSSQRGGTQGASPQRAATEDQQSGEGKDWSRSNSGAAGA